MLRNDTVDVAKAQSPAFDLPWKQELVVVSAPKVVYGPVEIPPIKRPVVRFKRGWCTSYVAAKRKVTWSGNAKYWYANAKRQGYTVGSTTAIKAIYVEPLIGSRNCAKCGHVSYVEKVEVGRFQVSEMNYVAFGVVSYRWVDTDEGQLFIY